MSSLREFIRTRPPNLGYSMFQDEPGIWKNRGSAHTHPSDSSTEPEEGTARQTEVSEAGSEEGIEDKSDVSEDKSDVSEDKSEVSEDKSDVSEDNSDVSEDNSDVSEDNSEVSEDNSDVSEDNSDVSEDKSDVSEDKSEVSEDKSEDKPQSTIDDLIAMVNIDIVPSRETFGPEETSLDETKKEETMKSKDDLPLQQEEEARDPTNWLLNNPNIIVHTSITDDVLPPYFNTSAPDMTAQFEQYHNLTRVIMDKRLDRIREQCKAKSAHLTSSQKYYYYFPEMGPEGTTWCPTFKAGSTNWKQFFCKTYKPGVYEAQLNNPEAPYCHLDVLRGYTYPVVKDKLGWMLGVKRSIKFATARHPYERLVSVYNNKFKDCEDGIFTDGRMLSILKQFRKADVPTHQKENYLKAAKAECHRPIAERTPDPNNPYMTPLGITFKELIQSIIFGKDTPDFHWLRTVKACDFCNVMNYDVVEKFETLERDHYYLLKMIGQEARYPDIQGLHTNPSGSSKQQLQSYFATLDERLLWSLRDIYRDDLDLFGYLPHYEVKKNPYS